MTSVNESLIDIAASSTSHRGPDQAQLGIATRSQLTPLTQSHKR